MDPFTYIKHIQSDCTIVYPLVCVYCFYQRPSPTTHHECSSFPTMVTGHIQENFIHLNLLARPGVTFFIDAKAFASMPTIRVTWASDRVTGTRSLHTTVDVNKYTSGQTSSDSLVEGGLLHVIIFCTLVMIVIT